MATSHRRRISTSLTDVTLVLDVSHTSKTRARAPIPEVGGPQVSVEEGAA